MTRSEYFARQQAARRSEVRVGSVWLVVFFAALVANVPIAAWVEREAPPWLKVTYLIAMFVGLFGNVAAVGWWLRSKPRRFGLLCGSCGAGLDGLNGYTAVATGNCGVCGSAVFTE
jgi:hypothetical protein